MVAILLLICFVLSCGNSDNNDPQSEVIVKVGSESITKDDLNRELNKLSQKQKAFYTSSSKKLNEFLENHINQKVLYKEANKRGIEDREEIIEQVNTYKQKLIAKTLGKEILQELELSDDEVKTYYEANISNYERVDISKIEIKYDEDTKASALAKAQEITERAKSGENFGELASEFSDDPLSKRRAGKVGYVNRGSFSTQIDEVIFELNEGDITKPFEVDGAYLIIKANKKPDVPPYRQIENTIRSELINQRLFDYIYSLRENWDVKVYEDRLEEMFKSESNEK